MKFKQLPLTVFFPLFVLVIVGCSDMSSSNSDEPASNETVQEADMQADTRITEFEAEEARREAALAECNLIENEQLRFECEADVAAR